MRGVSSHRSAVSLEGWVGGSVVAAAAAAAAARISGETSPRGGIKPAWPRTPDGGLRFTLAALSHPLSSCFVPTLPHLVCICILLYVSRGLSVCSAREWPSRKGRDGHHWLRVDGEEFRPIQYHLSICLERSRERGQSVGGPARV